jgi:hypothetical protein
MRRKAVAPGLLVPFDDEYVQEAVVAQGRAQEPDPALHEGPDLDGVPLLEAAPADEVEVPFPLDDRAAAALPPRHLQLPGAGGEVHQLHAQPAVHLPLPLGLLHPLARRLLPLGGDVRLLMPRPLPGHRGWVVEEVGVVELARGQDRAEAALDAVARDAEPVLVAVQVGARHELLGDEVHGEIGAEPQLREEMPAQARRLLSASISNKRRTRRRDRRKPGRDGGKWDGADGREVAEGRCCRCRVQSQRGGVGGRRRCGGLFLPRTLAGGGGGVVDDHLERALGAGETRRHLSVLCFSTSC